MILATATPCAPCIICASTSPRAHVATTSFGQLTRCTACGLAGVDPSRTAGDLAALHGSPEYFAHGYFAARRDLARDGVTTKHIDLIEFLTTGGPQRGARLLDIGCDTGALLCVARDHFGLDVAGVEVNAAAATVAREQFGVDVRVGMLDDVGFEPASFDYVTMVDVIEHVADPIAVLRSAAKLLRPGGRLFLVTPNHDALIFSIGQMLDRVAGSTFRGLIDRLYIPWHETYFDRRTLARALEHVGLTPGQTRTREFPLDEFGHGAILKNMLRSVFVAQALVDRQSLLEMVGERP